MEKIKKKIFISTAIRKPISTNYLHKHENNDSSRDSFTSEDTFIVF